MGVFVLLDTNDLVRMKIKVAGKVGLWETFHYYICLKNEVSPEMHNFTTKLFSLFKRGIVDTNSIHLVQHSYFKETTYLVLNEKFVISL